MHRLLFLLLAGCYSGGELLEGLADTHDTGGPRIAWDLEATPLPHIPFPNDVATRPDPSAATGRKVNASLQAPTRFERRLRQRLSELDGFGTFAPIWVQFGAGKQGSARLDLENIVARQKADEDFADDVALLIDVTQGSPTYGQAMVLDFGNGNFPITLEHPQELYDNDPRGAATSLITETHDEDQDGDGRLDVFEDIDQDGALDAGEDQDGDGRLDVAEDTDGDGVFDRANTWGNALGAPYGNDPYDDLIGFYDLEDETLWFRPLVPLRERTTYAVVLTKDLVGDNGEPVVSPFPHVNHLEQTHHLAPLVDDGLLKKYGRGVEDVAFAWTFTTQSVTSTLVALREGLHGVGPLAHLHAQYEPDVTGIVPVAERQGLTAKLLTPEDIVEVLSIVFERIDPGSYGDERIQSLVDTYGAVDYVVAGDFTSPDLLKTTGFADAPETTGAFDLDLSRGTVTHVPSSLRFFLSVPKAQYGTAPFPVALYCHGYTSLKVEALIFAGVLAKFGIATFVTDAAGHGLPFGDDAIGTLLELLDASGLKPFFDALAKGRERDLNGDGSGIPDPAGDFYTHDSFHTRDMVRQTLLDYLQAARVLRAFDGTRLFPFDHDGNGRLDDLAGDFDADGHVDVGGPYVPFYAMGMSMGGINSTVLGAIEPGVIATAPVSMGGGLYEIGLRTTLRGVRTAALLPIVEPAIITAPLAGDPRLSLVSFLVGDVFEGSVVDIGRIGRLQAGNPVDEMRAGDRFTVRNDTRGEERSVTVPPDRRVRLAMPSNKGDELTIIVRRPTGELVSTLTTFDDEVFFHGTSYEAGSRLRAIKEGLGMRRNSPEVRRLFAISQMILEPADPVNYVRHYRDPLAIGPGGGTKTSGLFYITMGDETVPVATGVSLMRAAGVIDYLEPDPRYGVTQNQLLIDTHVTESAEIRGYFRALDSCFYDNRLANFDIDDLSGGLHPGAPPRATAVCAPEEPCTSQGCKVCTEDCSGPNPPAPCSAGCAPLPPLRATKRSDAGIMAVRFPAFEVDGRHVIDMPDPASPFDASMFVINQIGLFLSSGGRVLSDHPCLALNDCSACAGEPDCPSIPAPTSVAQP